MFPTWRCRGLVVSLRTLLRIRLAAHAYPAMISSGLYQPNRRPAHTEASQSPQARVGVPCGQACANLQESSAFASSAPDSESGSDERMPGD